MTARKLEYCLSHEAGRSNPSAGKVSATTFGVERQSKAQSLLPGPMGQSICGDLIVKSQRHPVDREFPNCKTVDRENSAKSGAARGAVGSRTLREKISYQDERRTWDNPHLR